MKEELAKEKESRKQLWRMNCDSLREFDKALSEKDGQIADLNQQLERYSRGGPPSVRSSRADGTVAASGGVSVLATLPMGSVTSTTSKDKEGTLPVPSTPAATCPTPTVTPLVVAGDRLETSSTEDMGSSKRRRGKAPPIDKFSGEEAHVRFEDWLPSLMRVAEWYSWSED